MDPLEELIRAQPGLSIALTVLGLVVGSFLNVVIHRLPKMMEAQWQRDVAAFNGDECEATKMLSLAFPGSHCPTCQSAIKPQHNVPLVSYWALGGKMRSLRITHLTSLPID